MQEKMKNKLYVQQWEACLWVCQGLADRHAHCKSREVSCQKGGSFAGRVSADVEQPVAPRSKTYCLKAPLNSSFVA